MFTGESRLWCPNCSVFVLPIMHHLNDRWIEIEKEWNRKTRFLEISIWHLFFLRWCVLTACLLPSLDSQAFSFNKTDCHNITKILFKVALSTHDRTLVFSSYKTERYNITKILFKVALSTNYRNHNLWRVLFPFSGIHAWLWTTVYRTCVHSCWSKQNMYHVFSCW